MVKGSSFVRGESSVAENKSKPKINQKLQWLTNVKRACGFRDVVCDTRADRVWQNESNVKIESKKYLLLIHSMSR